MMRDLILKLSLPDEKAAAFEGANAMVTALSDLEAAELHVIVNGVDDFLAFNLKCLESLQEAIAADGDRDAQIGETLRQLVEPAGIAAKMQDRARELLGRAVFVGADGRRVLN